MKNELPKWIQKEHAAIERKLDRGYWAVCLCRAIVFWDSKHPGDIEESNVTNAKLFLESYPSRIERLSINKSKDGFKAALPLGYSYSNIYIDNRGLPKIPQAIDESLIAA